MLKFIQITDSHLISGGRRLYGVSPERRLHSAIDSINHEHADADFVVMTGDQVHWGDEDSYRILADAVARLEMPVKMLMGNHDNRQLMVETFQEIETDENGFVQSALETEAGRCLFLDTKIDAKTDAGEYCAQRRDWLKAQLEASHQPAIIFMHHPPLKLGLKGMDVIMLKDAEPFFQLLEPHLPRIRQIFFGHIHRPISGTWRGIPFSCVRGLNHQLALDLTAPETTVPGSFEPASYSVVLADADQIVIHMHEFMDRSPRFDLIPPPDTDGREYGLDMRHGDWELMT
ncbi:MAG: phosphodiesterase [Pseudomonadota bacterium]